jgi:hypothetical protein
VGVLADTVGIDVDGGEHGGRDGLGGLTIESPEPM